jgi:hypothetical protein
MLKRVVNLNLVSAALSATQLLAVSGQTVVDPSKSFQLTVPSSWREVAVIDNMLRIEGTLGKKPVRVDAFRTNELSYEEILHVLHSHPTKGTEKRGPSGSPLRLLKRGRVKSSDLEFTYAIVKSKKDSVWSFQSAYKKRVYLIEFYTSAPVSRQNRELVLSIVRSFKLTRATDSATKA